MKPIDFPGSNATYAKNQPQYVPLPSHRDEEGYVTSCWRLTLRERLRMLFSGVVWLTVATFNRPLQPVRLLIERPEDVPVPHEDPGGIR